MVSSREEPMLEKGADKREGDVFLFSEVLSLVNFFKILSRN
jgi:hypothetical protein